MIKELYNTILYSIFNHIGEFYWKKNYFIHQNEIEYKINHLTSYPSLYTYTLSDFHIETKWFTLFKQGYILEVKCSMYGACLNGDIEIIKYMANIMEEPYRLYRKRSLVYKYEPLIKLKTLLKCLLAHVKFINYFIINKIIK